MKNQTIDFEALCDDVCDALNRDRSEVCGESVRCLLQDMERRGERGAAVSALHDMLSDDPDAYFPDLD